MSDYPGLRIHSEARARWPDAGTEGAGWGSAAAHETVKRICREAALRCQQAIAVHAYAPIPDEDERTRSG